MVISNNTFRFKNVEKENVNLQFWIIILHMYMFYGSYDTTGFIWKVLGVYTCSMETIYLSLVRTGSWGTFFMKYPVGARGPKPFFYQAIFDSGDTIHKYIFLEAN